jgi:ABC-type uncharacterized transport system auxiliary subunit
VSSARCFALAIAVALVPGCAIFSSPTAEDVRWFTPELPAATVGQPEMQPERRIPLRLGPVTADSAIHLRVAYTNGLFEVGYYDTRRWTERPAIYVRRALERTLFDEGRFRAVQPGGGPTLDVNVLEFVEVQGPAGHAARVALRVTLSTDEGLVERTLRVTEPAPDASFESFVAAMAQALREVAGAVSGTVSEAIEGRAR